MSLAKYRQDAINRANNKTSSRILNDSLDHANILIETMIGMAHEGDTISIYSGNLPRDSFSESLKKTKASKIRIIVDDESKLQWCNELSSELLSKIEIKKIAKERPNHFFCVSSGAFRYETDALTYRAEANFNEPITSEKLSKAFDKYWRDATPVNF